MGAQGNKISNFTGIEKTQVKSSCVRFHFVKFEAFEFVFLGSRKNCLWKDLI